MIRGSIALVLIAVSAIGTTVLMASTVIASRSAPERAPLVCFPAGKWGPAPDRDRPCVYRLYEDGSVVVKQRDGGPVLADRP